LAIARTAVASVGSASEQQLTSVSTRTGAKIDQPVCRANDVSVVFDNDDGASGITKLIECFQQSLSVARMQAGGRFVKNQTRPVKLRTQGRRQSCPLKLAAGQCASRTIECEISYANIMQTFEIARNVGQRAFRDKSGFLRASKTSAVSIAPPTRMIQSSTRS
jgi:hypothetical protein